MNDTKQKFIAAIGVLVLGAAITMILQKTQQNSNSSLPKQILSIEQMQNIQGIDITKDTKSISLAPNNAGRWLIQGAYEIPVSGQKVLRLLEQMQSTKFLRFIASKENAPADIGLEESTNLTMHLQGKKTVLELGSQRKGGGGQYIGYDGKIYLINQNISISPLASSWELKKVIDIKPNELKSIGFKKHNETEFKFSRDNIESVFSLQSSQKNLVFDTNKKSKLTKILSNVDFAHKILKSEAPLKEAFAKPHLIEAETFDGLVFKIQIGKFKNTKKEEPEKQYMSFKILHEDNQSSEEVQFWNKQNEKWVYEVSNYIAQQLTPKISEFSLKKSDDVKQEKTN